MKDMVLTLPAPAPIITIIFARRLPLINRFIAYGAQFISDYLPTYRTISLLRDIFPAFDTFNTKNMIAFKNYFFFSLLPMVFKTNSTTYLTVIATFGAFLAFLFADSTIGMIGMTFSNFTGYACLRFAGYTSNLLTLNFIEVQ